MDPSHADPTVFNNCNGNLSGEGDVFGDPQFVNPTAGLGPQYDYATTAFHWMLQKTSPCIDAGATNMSHFYPDNDFTGNPRVVYGRIDLGAIELPDLDAVEETAAQSHVYPNPGRDVLHVATEWGNAFVVVYDLNGRKMCGQQVNGYSTNIATENWPSGMYLWKVVSTGSTTFVETGKWIKE